MLAPTSRRLPAATGSDTIAGMLRIEVLQTENELADEFLAALDARYLPEKFFYWFPLSVKAWLELCQGAQPYKNFSRSFQLVFAHAEHIAKECAGRSEGCMEVVSLGAGQGDKDLLVLQALREHAANDGAVVYRPVDASQALLELAVKRAGEAGFAVTGVKADVADPRTAEALATYDKNSGALAQVGTGEPADRLYLVLGNSLGVMDPAQFLQMLSGLLRPQDRILLDGEIFGDETTMAGYDNPVNRRFAFAPLASIGLEEGRDGALVFQSSTDERMDGLHLVTKFFRAARRLEIPVAGQRVTLEAEEQMGMNSSWKYSREAFLRLVGEAGALEVQQEFWSEDQRFLMVLAAPAAAQRAGR